MRNYAVEVEVLVWAATQVQNADLDQLGCPQDATPEVEAEWTAAAERVAAHLFKLSS